MTDMKDDSARGTGRTTALMLRVLADASMYPSATFRFHDHEPMCRAKTRLMFDALCSMARCLGLRYHITAGDHYIEVQAAHIVE